MQPSYKRRLVLEALEMFPESTTNSIAHYLQQRYPIDFDNFEAARTIVRAYRGEKKNVKPLIITAERSAEMRKQAVKRFSLPKSDYHSIPDFHVPKSATRGLILCDIHIPYQDNKALRAALDYGLSYKPNFIYLNGDIMDVYQLSRFNKDRTLRDFPGELELTQAFLQMLKNEFNCPIYFKIGNHEERYQHYLQLKAPELLGIPEFELKNLLHFSEYNVTEIKSRQRAHIGKLPINHGHEFGKQIFSPVNPARGLFLKTKHTGVIGHHHVPSQHSEKTIIDKYLVTWSIGCLCGLSPEYLPVNNWQHGFATIEVEPTGQFHFHNHRILEGVVYSS